MAGIQFMYNQIEPLGTNELDWDITTYLRKVK